MADQYENRGTVYTSHNEFYGLSVQSLRDYIASIRTSVISTSNDKSAVSTLRSGQEALFLALREGWTGAAEAKFETKFQEAVNETILILNDVEKRLEGYLNAIGNAWIEQDKYLIGDE